MLLILSQKLEKESDYKDIPFKVYHFPSRYKNQINSGDTFLYYQGDRHKKKNRYYFGCGKIGEVTSAEEGHYNAELLDTWRFINTVPIYDTNNEFYESIGYSQVRNKPNPAWQNSIRKISAAAFKTILSKSGMDALTISQWMDTNPMNESFKESIIFDTFLNNFSEEHIETLLENTGEQEIEKILASLDSSASIETRYVLQKIRKASRTTIDTLKEMYGNSCQICGINHQSPYGVDVTEAHHIDYFSKTQNHSPSNIVILCPNHHRLMHGAKAVFDRKRMAFVYNNGYEEYLKLNKHL
ncbi:MULTISPECIES: HNH endonuclease [Saccharibacillus]|uniref:HNH endonuclease n=1 Tax=Saccharibacillus TaxID=456492 RepID=UPI001238A4B1|nr:HNH endonuclease [Saccharibacillus sp. WB 17]MWJ30914.1 hypothetical protein [Saccharibacillus sp. WB 17]